MMMMKTYCAAKWHLLSVANTKIEHASLEYIASFYVLCNVKAMKVM